MSDERVFPGREWSKKPVVEMGFSESKLRVASRHLYENAQDAFQVVVIRGGYLVAEWYRGCHPDDRFPMASASKGLISSMLGIAVEEGKISSLDDKVVDYYPEMMEVGENEGPKPGRFAREKDRDLTFRQLISNMSGYMKPGEEPGKVFHYQSFGMCILQHTIAKVYGYYDSQDPDRLPGYGDLLQEKIRDPIGGTWRWRFKRSGSTWYKLCGEAKEGIFGYFTEDIASVRDMARMAYLWLNRGNWAGRQVIPEWYVQEATAIYPEVQASYPGPDRKLLEKFPGWLYSLGMFITTDSESEEVLWNGGGGEDVHINICPELDLVVAQARVFEERVTKGLYPLIVEACSL